MKRRILYFGLPEPFKRKIGQLVDKSNLTPVVSPAWATPTVVPQKHPADLRWLSDYGKQIP